MTDYSNRKRGSVLILSLWTIAFLAVLTIQVGLRVKHRATLVSHIETASQLHFLVEAGIKQAIAALRHDLEKNGQRYTTAGKQYRHNNPDLFRQIHLGAGVVDVSYASEPTTFLSRLLHYGFVDEERKINLNTADVAVLKRLVEQVTSLTENEALGVAEAIIDWRAPGRSTPTGFYSDDFYYSLEHHYPPKNAPFERIEELLLLPDVDERVYAQLVPFVTVYGDGRVNINTAPREVLLALGFLESLTDKIFSVRCGEDGSEFTEDDYVFRKTYDIIVELLKFLQLEMSEIKQINAFNAAGLLKTDSTFYLIKSQARLDVKKGSRSGVCVYNAHTQHIEYWREK